MKLPPLKINETRELLTVTEFAQRKGCNRGTILLKIKAGKIVKEPTGHIDWKKYKDVFVIPYTPRKKKEISQ